MKCEIENHCFMDKDVDNILVTDADGGKSSTIEIDMRHGVDAVVFCYRDVKAMAKHFKLIK